MSSVVGWDFAQPGSERTVVQFRGGDDFHAFRAAEAWCKAHGISVGRMQGPDPIGLLYGDFDIQKWRNLNRAEREALDGQITGDKRHGPVTVTVKPPKVAP